MTVVEQGALMSTEEVLPLMHSLQLDSSSSSSRPGRQQHKQPLLRRLQLQLQLQRVSPELVAIALVYFVQGILRLSSLAITFFEKDDLGMEPTQMAIADTIAGLPWTVKPLYGFITDSFPIRGMRRRPYLIIAGLVGSASWLCLAAFARTIPATIACITAAAAATAFSDVVADSIVVELARASPGATEGALQSLCWGSHAFGRVITAYLSGWLVDRAGVRVVFVITATFPLVVCLSSCLICEKKLAAAAAAAAAAADADAAADAADAKTNDCATPTLNGPAAAAAAGNGVAGGGRMPCSPSWLRKAAASPGAESIPEDADFEPRLDTQGPANGYDSSSSNLQNAEISPASPLCLTAAYELVMRQQQQQQGCNRNGLLAAAAFPAGDLLGDSLLEQQQQQQQQGEQEAVPAPGVYSQLSFGIWGEDGMAKKVDADGRFSFENRPSFDNWQQQQPPPPQQQRRLQPLSSFGFVQAQAAAAVVAGSNPGPSRTSSCSSDAAGKAKAAAWQQQQQHWWEAACSNMVQSLALFWAAVKQPHVLRPVMFLFLWQAMPSVGTAMFYFKTNRLGFDAEFFGRVKLVAALADLLGIVVYNSCLKRVRLRQLMLWGSLLGCGLGLTPLLLVEGVNRRLGISDRAFALVDSALLASVGQVLLMPTLVLAARLCPVGVEGALYASLMSVNNFASGTSEALGAIMMKFFGITSSNFAHLSALLLTANLLSLLPLPLIGWVPDESAADAAAAAAAGEGEGAAEDMSLLGAVRLTVKSGGSGGALVASPRQRGSGGGGSSSQGGGRSYHKVPEVEIPDWGAKHS